MASKEELALLRDQRSKAGSGITCKPDKGLPKKARREIENERYIGGVQEPGQSS